MSNEIKPKKESMFGVRRLVLPPQPLPPEDDTQPNPGWGFICPHCKHTFADDKKYVDYPPELPCKRVQFTRGYYDNQMRYFSPVPIFDLKRYVDGSESCHKYEPAESQEKATQ